MFAGVSALWGAPYLLIKIAVHELSPTVIACSRTAIGAIALLPLAQRSGAVRPIRDRWRWLLLLAAVEMAVPFTLITAGERHIASSLATPPRTRHGARRTRHGARRTRRWAQPRRARP